jgi:Glycosyl transferase family 2
VVGGDSGYNEVERLPRSLDEVLGFFDGRGLSYEVLVVDDGSPDGTPDLVRAVSRLHPAVQLLRGEDKRGKGAAVRAFRRVRTNGFGFDVELLLLARAAGYRVVEVPVNWTDQPGQKEQRAVGGPRMLVQILKARCRVPRSA